MKPKRFTLIRLSAEFYCILDDGDRHADVYFASGKWKAIWRSMGVVVSTRIFNSMKDVNRFVSKLNFFSNPQPCYHSASMNSNPRNPWNWTAQEMRQAYREYMDNGGELSFRVWIRKHRSLELACESSFADVNSLSAELHV